MRNGRWVNVVGTFDSNNHLVAKTVVFVNPSFSKTAWNNSRDMGKVSQVNLNANTFVLNGRYGSTTYTVNANTTSLSNVSKLNELKKGMVVSLAYTKQPDKTLLVTSLIAYPQPK